MVQWQNRTAKLQMEFDALQLQYQFSTMVVLPAMM
jgi:hypothetical protein